MTEQKSRGEIFSHSRISTYESCPLKFKFRYIDRVKVAVSETIEQFMGKRVHEALEHLYKTLQMGRLLSLEELAEYYNKIWTSSLSEIETAGEEILVAKEGDGLSVESYRRLGERCVRDYYSAHSPFDREGTTIGLEAKVMVLLPGGERLIGYIDRLSSRGEGIYEIHDYKTNSRLKSQEELDSDRQLALYALAVKQQYPDAKKVRLVWHFLVFGKELRSERTDRELRELGKRTAELVEKIRGAKEFPAHESKLCEYCEYQEICPKRKHLFSGKNESEEKGRKVDGEALADSYARLKDQGNKIDAELENLRAAILTFSKESGAERIFGKEYVVGIRSEEIPKFPKDGKERKKMLSLLKKSDLWEEVEDVNVFALRRLIKEGKLKGDVAKTIVIGQEERKTLTVSKRKNY